MIGPNIILHENHGAKLDMITRMILLLRQTTLLIVQSEILMVFQEIIFLILLIIGMNGHQPKKPSIRPNGQI